MKKVEAIIRPFKLEDVKQALRKAGFPDFDATVHRGTEPNQKRAERLMVNLMDPMVLFVTVVLPVKEEDLALVTQLIFSAAQTHWGEDCRMTVLQLERCIDITTRVDSVWRRRA